VPAEPADDAPPLVDRPPPDEPPLDESPPEGEPPSLEVPAMAIDPEPAPPGVVEAVPPVLETLAVPPCGPPPVS